MPEPQELLEEMHAAEAANRAKAARFVYTEDIRYNETLPDGAERGSNWVTYEVTFVAGEPFNRMVAIRGEPLPPEEAEAEEQRYRKVEQYRLQTPPEERRRRYFAADERRFKIDTYLVLRYHHARFLGEQPLHGRDTWVIETTPKRGTPKPKRRSEAALDMKIRYWIDKQTHLPIHLEAEWLHDFDGAPKGARVESDLTEVDGVWLAQRIVSTGQRKTGKVYFTYRNDQRYSNYKRFSADTKLLLDNPE